MTTYEITFNEKTAAGKNILAFLEKNKKYVKVNAPKVSASTKMTKKEFYAMIDEALAQYERGEYTELGPDDDISKFLEEL